MMKNELETMTITLTREEAQQVLDALENNAWIAPIGSTLSNFGLTLRPRLSAPEPERLLKLGDMEQRAFDQECEFLSAAQPEPEPVAWNCAADLADASICKSWCGNSNCISHIAPSKPESEYESQPEPEPIAYKVNDATVYIKPPIYNAPPQRKWQGLTAAEMMALFPRTNDILEKRIAEFACAIEAKLKEKNA